MCFLTCFCFSFCSALTLTFAKGKSSLSARHTLVESRVPTGGWELESPFFELDSLSWILCYTTDKSRASSYHFFFFSSWHGDICLVYLLHPTYYICGPCWICSPWECCLQMKYLPKQSKVDVKHFGKLLKSHLFSCAFLSSSPMQLILHTFLSSFPSCHTWYFPLSRTCKWLLQHKCFVPCLPLQVLAVEYH